MNKDEQILQKAKKIGGYDRLQVLEYIKKLREEYEEELTKERDRLKDARETAQRLENKVTELSDANTQLNEKLYHEQRHAGELNLTINKLNIEISGQRVEINERERQNLSLQGQLEEMREDIRILGEKAKRYEELKCKVGDMMLEAKASSDRLMSNANRQAAEIMQDARREAEELVKQAHGYLNSINQDILTLRNQISAGRKYAADLTESILNGLNSVELVVNSMDFSINRDDEFETELDLLADIIAESHNREDRIQDEDYKESEQQ